MAQKAFESQSRPGGRRAARRGAAAEPLAHAPAIETLRGPARVLGGQLQIRRFRPAALLCGLTLILCWLIFPPIGWWPLAYVCLVPWLVVVCSDLRARRVYFLSYLLGVGFFLIHIRWLYPVTAEGYAALACYFAIYFPLAAWPIRHMYRRRGLSVAITAPIAWTAFEFIRSHTDLGFPWVLLGHSQYKVLTLIQISDLAGAYGVSFVVAMVNGWITDLLVQPILVWRDERPEAATRLPLGSLTTLLVVLGTIIYGVAQTSSAQFEAGPKVAIVQGDFEQFVDDRQNRTTSDLLFETYLEVTQRAAKEKPDLIVLPETPWPCFLNDEFVNARPEEMEEMRSRRFVGRRAAEFEAFRRFGRYTRDAFQSVATEQGVPIVLGSLSVQWRPKGIPPRVDCYNSALLLTPGRESPADRYDKRHLVIFGEYVPFRFTLPALYRWLSSLSPFGAEGTDYSLSPGEAFKAFEFTAASRGRSYRAGTPICYEEIMPYVARAFVTGDGADPTRKNIDMLLTISNDGWFGHSAELEQHLAGAVFRAVENRIAVARSVNTGTSALIDPNGRIHHRVRLDAAKFPQLEAVANELRKIQATAQRVADRIAGSSQPFQDAGQEMMEVSRHLNAELPAALTALGPDYGYIAKRLDSLMREVTGPAVTPLTQRVATLIDQLGEDIATTQRWRDRPETAPGYLIGELRCDSRVTVYSRWGEWFAEGMLGLTVLMLLDWIVQRVRGRPATPAAAA